MADISTASGRPKRRGGWFRKLLGILVVLLVLLVVAYFVVTSTAFFKGVILPKVSQSLNADVTVSDASISPFSRVILRDLKVQAKGFEPVVTAQEVHAHYSLWDIIRGHIKVDEVVLALPLVQIIQGPDGKSNLDPLRQSAKKDEKKTEPGKSSSQPPQIDINKVTLNNATVRLVKNYKSGGRDFTELSNVNLNLANLKNGQAGKLALGADIRMDINRPAPGTNGLLQAKLDGNFTFDLSSDLKPTAVKGNSRVIVQKAGGSLSDLTSLAAILDCDVTPTNVKQIALRFQKGETALSEVRASGPFDVAKTEGRLTVEILSIDRQVLNLLGAAKGIDFGGTTINSTNQVELAKGGSVVTTIGQFNLAKFSATQKGQTTPPLDLHLAYNVTVNQDDKVALLQTLNLNGIQNQKPLLRGELTSPMKLSWGEGAAGAGDSALNLAVTNLNLADWKAFLGTNAPMGVVNLTVKLLSQQSGKQLNFDLASRVDDLAVNIGSNQLKQAAVTLEVRGQAADLKRFNLTDYRLQLTHQGQWLVLVSGSGRYDTEAQDANLQTTVEAMLPRLLQALGRADANASSGMLTLKSRIIQKQQTQTVSGNLAVADFTGRYGDYKFDQYNLNTDLDIEKNDTLLKIRKAAGTIRQGQNPGGAFDVAGNLDTSNKTTQLTIKLEDLNQNALRPFLAAALGDKKLVSISITANTAVNYSPEGDSSVKGDLQVAKLLVEDPKKQLPATPLEAKAIFDASIRKQVLDLRQFQINLTPTARAKNEVQLKGRVDMSNTNATQGALKLVAESLDVTPYYDLFADKPKSEAPTTTTSTTPAPAPAPTAKTEPPAVKLPFQNFTMDVDIGRFFLREVDIAKLQTGVKLDGGHVVLKPFQLALNGAPVSANVDLNLGVPGYQYDITFSADRIPLEPLANMFVPEKRGMYKGQVIANAQIKGAGTTGVNLRKALTGQLGFYFTNANIQIVSPRLKSFLTPIALVLNAPDLLESPLSRIDVTAQMGNGQIVLKQLNLVSSAFTADTQGAIPIADDLMNSPLNNWPMNFYLRRSLAQKVGMVPKDTPPTAEYARLPNFVTVDGTLNTPKPKIDKLALGGALLEKFGGKIPGVNEKTGNVLQGLGNIISGNKSGGTNATAGTNQPPPGTTNTNKPPAFNPLDLFKRPAK